jgi:hypothetical protein
MISYTLVIIMMAYPNYQNGGVASSVVIPGFTTEMACQNAARKIAITSPPNDRTRQINSVTCVALTI